MKRSRRWIACVAMLALNTPTAWSQDIVPPPPPAPTHTVWSALGIPQGVRKVKGAMWNRGGNHPRLEPKPPLKALADPANLLSDVPIIKKAAEVKMAEDLKPQKIKAIRYLTTIGCGCYDTDGSITEALLAASDDCTEAVRLATVQAIAEAAAGKCCSNCGLTCCCKEPIVKRLAQMAYERDDAGCYLEPSERVREAAAQALRICCPNEEPVEIEAPEAVEAPPPIREGAPEEPAREGGPDETPPPPPEEPGDVLAPPDEDEAVSVPAPVNTPRVVAAAARPIERPAPVQVPDFRGVVVHSDPQRGAAHVHVEPRDAQLPVGAPLFAYHQVDGALVFAGQLSVYQSFPGSINVQLTSDADLAAIHQGAIILPRPVEKEQQPAPVVAAVKTPVRKVVYRGGSVAAKRATTSASKEPLATLRELINNAQ